MILARSLVKLAPRRRTPLARARHACMPPRKPSGRRRRRPNLPQARTGSLLHRLAGHVPPHDALLDHSMGQKPLRTGASTRKHRMTSARHRRASTPPACSPEPRAPGCPAHRAAVCLESRSDSVKLSRGSSPSIRALLISPTALRCPPLDTPLTMGIRSRNSAARRPAPS